MDSESLEVLHEVHRYIKHQVRNEMMNELFTEYKNITRIAIE